MQGAKKGGKKRRRKKKIKDREWTQILSMLQGLVSLWQNRRQTRHAHIPRVFICPLAADMRLSRFARRQNEGEKCERRGRGQEEGSVIG